MCSSDLKLVHNILLVDESRALFRAQAAALRCHGYKQRAIPEARARTVQARAPHAVCNGHECHRGVSHDIATPIVPPIVYLYTSGVDVKAWIAHCKIFFLTCCKLHLPPPFRA